MSYDLFFKPNERLTKDSFCDYFRKRAGYELNGGQAWYSNEDTGVYFSFDWIENDEPLEVADKGRRNAASFNMNYCRPEFFGLEAEPEVRSFVEHFGASLYDPQTEGMGEGPYSSEGFLRGWGVGNRFGVQVLVSRAGPSAAKTLPSAELERIWTWNLGRRELQAQLDDSVFVAKIFLFELDRKVHSFIVWGDGVPVAFPRVDLVVLLRETQAPRKLLFRRPDTVLASWVDVADVLDEFVHKSDADPEYWLLEDFEEMPPGVKSWFTSQGGDAHILKDKTVPMDQVVSAEAVTAAAEAGHKTS